MSQKIVLKMQLNCEKCKQRVLKTAAGVEGVVSVAVDAEFNKVTVIGDADPVCLTARLRKIGFAELESVGPSKEPNPPRNPDPPNITYVILPSSCPQCSSFTFYFSDDSTNACSIL